MQQQNTTPEDATIIEDVSLPVSVTTTKESSSTELDEYDGVFGDESSTDPKSDDSFMPVEHLRQCLAVYLPEAEVSPWISEIHEDAVCLSTPVEQRMFLVNRTLRLKIAEMAERDTMRGRMLISDQLTSQKWALVISKAVAPFIAGKLVAEHKPAPKAGNNRMDKAAAAKKARKLAQKQRRNNR
jgi:hypothetical protein